MQLTKELSSQDLALFHKKSKTLIIADLHIGYEEALNKQGILVPRFQQKELTQRLLKILIKTNPSTIIINGDFKHEFGTISETEWRHALRIFDLLAKHSQQIILVKGNHDTILGPIAKKRNLEIVDHFILNNIYITHGHKIPTNQEFKKAKTLIIAHEHPAIGIREDIRVETFKCFLVGKWKSKNLIVMPSFNLVTEGTDILQEQLLSPFLTNINNLEVYVVADKIYKFGKIKNII